MCSLFSLQDSVECTKKLIAECYRVLAEGGIHISFSLHSVNDVLAYFRHKDFKWEVKPYRIINPRWNSSESKRSVAHTMIICQKLPLNPKFPQEIKGVLSDKEYDELVERATKINEESLFKKASLQRMLDSLDRALELQLASLPLKPLPAVDVSNE